MFDSVIADAVADAAAVVLIPAVSAEFDRELANESCSNGPPKCVAGVSVSEMATTQPQDWE